MNQLSGAQMLIRNDSSRVKINNLKSSHSKNTSQRSGSKLNGYQSTDFTGIIAQDQNYLRKAELLAAQSLYNVTKNREEQSKLKISKDEDQNRVNVPKLNLIVKEDLLKQKKQFDQELDELEQKMMKQFKKHEEYFSKAPEYDKKKQIVQKKQSEQQLKSEKSDKITESLRSMSCSQLLENKKTRLAIMKILEERLEEELKEQNIKSKEKKQEDHEEFVSNISSIKRDKERKWLVKHGKGHYLDFTDQEIKKLKECFASLDISGTGSIGISQLEEPLIGLGLAENQDEIQRMIDEVDEDGSGMIEFDEFLQIINDKGDKGPEEPVPKVLKKQKKGKKQDEAEDEVANKTQQINQFFKNMTNGKLGDEDLPFNVVVANIRRKHMMKAILKDGEEKEQGMRILKNVEVQLNAAKMRNKDDI